MTSAQPIRVTIGPYTVTCTAGLPPLYGQGVMEGTLIDEFDLDSSNGDLCCIEVSSGDGSSSLVVAQRYSPGAEIGFSPGILLVPETRIAFIGAGERVLAYDLAKSTRLWEERTYPGFLEWARHGDWIVMSAELELSVWTIRGEKVSSSFVEPPWEYTVEGDTITLDVMGLTSTFGVREGRPPG